MNKAILTLIAFLLLERGVCAAPFKSFQEGFASRWECMTVALAIEPGCIPMLKPVELILCRKGDELTLLVRKTDDSGNQLYSPRRAVSRQEFTTMIGRLERFYERAKDETDLNEYFDALPEEQHEREFAEYVKTHGQPFGGFPSTYFYTRFEPGAPGDSAVIDAFAENETISGYTYWLFSFLQEI